MANDILNTVFKGVLEGDRERYLHLYEKVEDSYFDGPYSVLWKILCRVYDVSKQIIDRPTLDKVLPAAGLSVEMVVQVEDLWRQLEVMPPVSEADFAMSVHLLQEDHRTNLTGEALTGALEILRIGVKEERTGVVKQGASDALEYFREHAAAFESIGAEPMPEFNIRTQKDDILAELLSEDNMSRVSTGIVPLDEMTMGGHGKGELWIPVAGTGVGKSMICTNIAWHRLIQGDNVVYFTTETLFHQIRHRIVMRHTHLPQFGVPNGLSSMKVKMHSAAEPTLSDTEYEAYVAAVTDFTENPEYGQLVVIQIPDKTRMSAVVAKLYRWKEILGSIDYCIIDSLDMLAAEMKRSEQRHELDEVVNGAKALCVSFDHGTGLRVLAPWQASRHGQEEAKQSGRYKINALGDTHMAAKRADLVGALLENEQAPTKLKFQTLKFRDASPEDFEVDVFYDHAYIGSDVSLRNDDIGGLESIL